ncbi:MAG: transcriptional regulator, partial [Lachnospiraceae bacterium]|nr:transcriptional regulator [Lachnospiraceae bacterium]
KENSYEEVFLWVKEKIEDYPNCNMLIWQLATILDAQRMFHTVSDSEKYDTYILSCYERVLESEDEKIRTCAADSLFGYYMRKEQYEKAEGLLCYYSEQNPERKRKQAMLYGKMGRVQESYKAYEEILFSGYQMLSMVFNSIYMLAMQDGNLSKAHKMVEKQQELARLFEMGAYYEVSCALELALKEKDAEAVIEIAQKMLESVEEIGSFSDAELYEHMTFKKLDENFGEGVRENLIKLFQEDEAFEFLKDDVRWKNIFM